MSWFAVTATVIAAGVSAYGVYQQGQAQEKAAEYNAKVAQQTADNEAEVATENVTRQREENKRRLAAIRASMAGSGVNIGAGSSLDVLGESASELELQALDLFRDADSRQKQLRSEASMSLWQGKQASSAANISAVGTLFSGAASAAGTYQSSVIRSGNT